MQGDGPDDLALGRLARKLAQDSGSVAERYQAAGRPQGQNYGSLGYQHGTEGTTTIPAEVSGAASAAFGPEAGALVQMLTMFAQPAMAEQGIDLTQRFEKEYGVSADDAREAQSVMNAVRAPAMAEAGNSVTRLIGGVDQALSKVSGGKLNGMVSKFWNMIPGDATAKGMFVSNIAMAVPEVKDFISRMDPKLVLDFTPLVNATYMRNGGKFNAQDFKQLHDSFMQMRDQNQLGNVPAQVSIEAVPFAIKHIGPQATAQQISGLSMMAHKAQQAGLAPNYGAALEMLDSFGSLGAAAKNPNATFQYLDQLKDRIRESGLDEASVYEMGQMAKQKGIPLRSMIEGQIGGAEASKLFRDNPVQQRQVQNAAMQTFENLGQSDSMKALSVLSQRDPRWKATIDKAISTGNTKALNSLAATAMRDPANWRRMQSADTSALSQSLSNAPGMTSGMISGEAERFAKNTGNLELGRLLANKKEMTRRLTTQDYNGLSDRTVDALSPGGRFGGRLGASFLAANASNSRPAPRTPIDTQPPLTRWGVQYGEPATVPGANGVPKPAPLDKIPAPPIKPNALGVI